MSSCLIVIDAQESFRHRPYFTATVPQERFAQISKAPEALARAESR
jgi:hypothetical protein